MAYEVVAPVDALGNELVVDQLGERRQVGR